MNKVVVFGASGVLGSAIVNHLSMSRNVVAIVRPSSNVWRLDENPNIEIRALDEAHWPDAIPDYEVDIVCAQWQGTQKNLRDNDEYQFENLNQISAIADAAINNNCKNFIVLGSQAETLMSTNPVEEIFLNNPSCTYGFVKVALLERLQAKFRNSQTRFVWARVFSVFSYSENTDTLLPNLVRSKELGTTIVLANPDLPWSFLPISDFVEAMSLILGDEYFENIVNIANPNLISIKNFCDLLDGGRYTIESQLTWDGRGYFPIVKKLESKGWKAKSNLSKDVNDYAGKIWANISNQDLS